MMSSSERSMTKEEVKGTSRSNDDTSSTSITTVEQEAPTIGCGVLARYPVLSVLGFAAVGIGLGLGLSFWEPEDPNDKDTVLQWVGLIGDLFIRALKCVVLPLVFANVILSVVEMLTVGRAGAIGGKTIGFYLLTTVAASILGIISIVSFKGLFEEGDFETSVKSTIRLGCDGEGSFLAHMPDGSVTCTANFTDDSYTTFFLHDVDSTFVTTSSGPANDISLSDTIYQGVFEKLISNNIVESFVEANFAAVVMFAMVFGLALGRVVLQKTANLADSFVICFLKEIDEVFLLLINWIISITPFAVLSLIANAIGKQDDLAGSFRNVGYLVAATILAMAVHFCVVYVGLYTVMTRSNPWSYFKHLIPAQTTAFACASSAATIPVTMQSVKATGKVPEAVSRFVIPMGAVINMDGGAIYFPCACIWMAVINGIEPTFGNYILLVILATVGSAGAAPVPSASLVLIITAYNTVFGTTGTPEGFSFILAIDWFMDRLRTTLNVTGDAIVCGLVAHTAALDTADSTEDASDPGTNSDEEGTL
ncbi:Putative sodium-dependent excitatory amino acid transporter glt [Seminavis robusta]|uniref:Amino acid transporter n=1 Tax=Seminavis robusta TaxID=568900 RepID=A0A9N8HPY8_9STRA|nr:Putative sodium-dependent excitatory amino acid transporter glt [Seminavis robusta]|eukprot:Sro1141_g245680.1 Putative sodium-dependent excitatory amino acid transporter glt (536) ;mRNA; r:26856-28463